MQTIENILVGLDFTDSDISLLRYVKAVNKVLKPKKIVFVNVHSSISLPDEILTQFPDLLETIDNKYIEELINEITPLNLYGAETECLALNGNPLEEILTIIKKEQTDLLIVGKKKEHNHVHLAHRKLIRKAPCHLLVVPDNSKPKFDKIVSATDFSENSKMALSYAELIAHRTKGKLICEHIYEVPLGFHKTGKSYTDFARIMRAHAEHAFESFLPKLNFEVEFDAHFTLNDSSDVGETLIQVAKDLDADLVVTGAKGKSGWESVLMGSVTESLSEHDHSVPLLIIKEKNHSFSFWKDFYGLG